MTPQQVYYCSECGRQTPPEELARFGDRLVCSYCKNTYAQKLREGVAPVTAMRYGGFWLRFVAVLIDGIILAIPIGILEVVIFGAVRGNIEVIEKLAIRDQGRVIGDIKTAGISIDDGAYFKGSIDIVRAEPKAKSA